MGTLFFLGWSERCFYLCFYLVQIVIFKLRSSEFQYFSTPDVLSSKALLLVNVLWKMRDRGIFHFKRVLPRMVRRNLFSDGVTDWPRLLVELVTSKPLQSLEQNNRAKVSWAWFYILSRERNALSTALAFQEASASLPRWLYQREGLQTMVSAWNNTRCSSASRRKDRRRWG